MPLPGEQDFAAGHPARSDYNPASPDCAEWARVNISPEGQRDFPVDHPKALDTKGNTNHLSWPAGVDPRHPELEPHTGRTAEQAKAHRDAYQGKVKHSKPTPAREPVMAPAAVPDPAKVRVQVVDGGGYKMYDAGAKEFFVLPSDGWQFNGSRELPSFTPSIVRYADDPQRRSHFFVTNGQLIYLPDSAHALAGKTVELPSIAEVEGTKHA